MIGLHWTVTTRWLQAHFYSVLFFLFEISNRGLKGDFLAANLQGHHLDASETEAQRQHDGDGETFITVLEQEIAIVLCLLMVSHYLSSHRGKCYKQLVSMSELK